MKTRKMTLLAILLAIPATALAEVSGQPGNSHSRVDCKRAVAELRAGRTPQEVINIMGILQSDLNACQAEQDREAQRARARGDDSVPDGSTSAPTGSVAR
jgi:hypothetical protein